MVPMVSIVSAMVQTSSWSRNKWCSYPAGRATRMPTGFLSRLREAYPSIQLVFCSKYRCATAHRVHGNGPVI